MPTAAPTRYPTDLALLLRSALEIVLVALFLVMFVAQPFRVPSASMQPTMRVGDLALMDKQAFAPMGWLHGLLPSTLVRRGDLVVFLYPVDPTHTLVKRVIALPGDRLRLQHGHVLIDGHPLAEPYASYSIAHANAFRDRFPNLQRPDPAVDPAWWAQLRVLTQEAAPTRSASSSAASELTIPPDDYFVLGDNRNDSEDSRYWGFVPREALLGRPLGVYLSANAPPHILR